MLPGIFNLVGIALKLARSHKKSRINDINKIKKKKTMIATPHTAGLLGSILNSKFRPPLDADDEPQL